jgi:putative sigma-54 modulation protein
MNHNGEVSIRVTSKRGHVSQRMEEYATQKASKLPRFNDQISRIEIVVDGPHEAPEVEMLVHVDNRPPIVASVRSEHFNGAIDALIGKLERQLVKAKEKLKKHKGDARRAPGLPESPDEPVDGSQPRDARP